MSSRFLSQLAVLGLVLVGVTSITLRHRARESARESLEDSLWRLTYHIGFTAEGNEAEARIALPSATDNVVIENGGGAGEWAGDQLRYDTPNTLQISGTRELNVFTRQPGDYHVIAEFEMRLRPSATRQRKLENLSADARSRYLRDEATLPIRSSDVQKILQAAQGEWSEEEELLQWIFDFCSRDLKDAGANDSSDVVGTLFTRKATTLGRARTMVTLCRASGIPARLVSGFELRQQENVKPHVWVEAFRGNHWAPFDPEFGYARYMPINFIAVRRDGVEIVRTRQSAPRDKVTESYSIVRLGPPARVLQVETRHPAQVFDLTRLPVEMHEVLSLMLLLPFGALVVAFFRNVIGIATLGTFAPTLFAVSFIYADWTSGLIVLLVILFAGLAGRLLVERLQLLMVPRLSIILTTIVLCVVLGVSALDYLNLTPSKNAVLLPLVILTVLIERFYVTIEEDGAGFALRLVLGTVFVSTCCYLLLRWEPVGRFILVYPEAHLLTIAAFVLIGRYTGYRLVELWRFRDMVGADSPR